MNGQTSIANLAAALVKAQAEIEDAVKDKVNPHLKAKYADLSSVMEAIKPALAKHALGFVQVSHDANNAAAVETIIVHSSGETLSCGVLSVPVSKGDAQGFGSALTYARRYSLAAAFGVAPEDDDGVAASSKTPKAEPPRKLLDEALAAAQGGTQSYRQFWQKCPPENRALLEGKLHADFKALAQENDPHDQKGAA